MKLMFTKVGTSKNHETFQTLFVYQHKKDKNSHFVTFR